jgi:integrase
MIFKTTTDLTFYPSRGLSSVEEGLTMKGTIICSKCSKKMTGEQCQCGHVRCKIVIYWQGKHHKISRDRDGDPIGYKAASRKLESIRNEIDERVFDLSNWQAEKLRRIRFDELAWQWLAEKEAAMDKGRFAHATLASYQSTMRKHLIPCFGAMDIRDIKRPLIKDYFEQYLYNKGIIKKTSKQNHQIILHSFMSWVRDDREILKALPPFPKIDGDESEPRRAMEVEEQLEVIERIPQPFRDMIALGMETGLRPAEICALQVRDIDQANAEAIIRRTFSRTTLHEHTKQKRAAVIPLTDTAMEIIQLYVSDKLPTAFIFLISGKPIFPHVLGTRWNTYSGTDYTINEAMRHSFGSQLAAAGAPTHDIQQLMRHSTFSMTERYLHRLKGTRENLRATVTQIRSHRNELGTDRYETQTTNHDK